MSEVTDRVIDGTRPWIDSAMRRAVAASASAPSRTGGGAPAPVTGDLKAAIIELERARKGTESAIVWAYAYRMGVLMVPYVVALVMVTMLVVPISDVVGVGPLSRWAWGSFEAADSWGTKTWIALAILAVVAGVGYGVYRVGKVLVDTYRAHYSQLTAKR